MWKILIVDDDINMREMLEMKLSMNPDYAVTASPGAVEAIDILKKEDFDLIISDYKMPHINGVELLNWCKTHKTNDYQFLIMTAYGDIKTSVEAMRLGAFDFIEKNPESFANMKFLESLVARVLKSVTMLKTTDTPKDELKPIIDESIKYVGKNQQILNILNEVSTFAVSKASVLITGESGTGKELISKNIHYKSDRFAAPFIKINCAAIPETLIESELFGFEKGAFTGAEKTRKGKFELAHGGTLLLDEIGEMPMHMQSKLLRVLQEREITRVGGSESYPIDVRIIATTNRDLIDEINNGNFREDLYFRLDVVNIHLLSLRERKDDIKYIASHFIKYFNNENGFTVDETLSKETIEKLIDYEWPGNIRQLQNVIERAVIYKKTGKLAPEDVILNRRAPKINKAYSTTQDETDSQLDEFAMVINAGMSLAEVEKKLIELTLKYTNNNRNSASEILNITSRTLRNKLQQYKLEEEETNA